MIVSIILVVMPELPEVETVCLGIKPHVIHKSIKEVIIRQPNLRWPVPANLSQLLTKTHIEAINRRGKYLLLKAQ